MHVCLYVCLYVCKSVWLSVCCLSMCMSLCLSVCLYACSYVYIFVCQNEGFIGTLCACCETCQTILAPESSKSVNVQKVSQTDQMILGGS